MLTVTELNAAVQRVFSDSFTQVWVSGEISSYRVSSNGHHYFCLKDAQSQIKCVLFKGTERFLRIKPRDGLAVAAKGNLELYQSRGEYQLIVDRLELHGEGSLQLAFEKLKARLEAEGLFLASRKRPLPRHPRRIGLVTSQGGAVLHDILQILARRFPGLHVRLYPVQVQGEGSADQICSGLDYFSKNRWPDVIILARGGGSLEDLWSFNDERLARTIAGAGMPVISAVGHETDFTIADFVSDYRAPTPSAAAEIVIGTRDSLLAFIDETRLKMIRAMSYRLLFLYRDVNGRSGDRGFNQVRRAIARRMQRLDDADIALRSVVRSRLEAASQRLGQLSRRLHETNLLLRFARNRNRQDILTGQLLKEWRSFYWRRRQRLDIATSHLVQLSPLGVLARGYAIVQNPSQEILRSSSQTHTSEELTIRLYTGKVKAIVSEIET